MDYGLIKKRLNDGIVSAFLLQMITDGLWIIVMFLSDSHSDGTHSLQSIHYWDTDAETHFYKPDEETNSSTSWMARGWAFLEEFSFL